MEVDLPLLVLGSEGSSCSVVEGEVSVEEVAEDDGSDGPSRSVVEGRGECGRCCGRGCI